MQRVQSINKKCPTFFDAEKKTTFLTGKFFKLCLVNYFTLRYPKASYRFDFLE